MPYYQRQAELDRSLAAYRAQYADLDLEFSVCDDGSTPSVHAPGCLVTTLPQKTTGLNPCVPINAAVRASSGDVIVLTNPEIEHREPTLKAMLTLMEQADDYVVARCRDVSGEWLAGPQVNYSRKGRMPVPPGAHFHFCAMLTRTLFEKAGGFDEQYRHGRACEDNDWLWALEKVGARFVLCESTVWHYKTPHAYDGTRESNVNRLVQKWGHKWQ